MRVCGFIPLYLCTMKCMACVQILIIVYVMYIYVYVENFLLGGRMSQ
jgi:hypothetical protein